MSGEFKKITTFFQRKNALFVLGLCGILLIFLSDTLSGKSTPSDAELSAAVSVSEYQEQMQLRLEQALIQIEGAGDVQVFLTVEDSGFGVYALDERASNETKTQSDGITQRSSTSESEHVLSDGSPILESSLEPTVRGVSVVCEGGDDIKVVARITEFISVGLGLPTNRICVTKMK